MMTLMLWCYVILLSMLVILTSNQNLIGSLICGNNLNWLLNLNLNYELLDCFAKWLICKFEFWENAHFSFDCLNGAIVVGIEGNDCGFEKNHLLSC